MFLAPSQNLFSKLRIQSSSLSILHITFQEHFLSCHLHFVLQEKWGNTSPFPAGAWEHTVSLTSHAHHVRRHKPRIRLRPALLAGHQDFLGDLAQDILCFPWLMKSMSHIREMHSMPCAHTRCLAHTWHTLDMSHLCQTAHQHWLQSSSLTSGTGWAGLYVPSKC